MKKAAKIAVIACSNGLGHIKRDIKIINTLRQSEPVLVDLFCEEWQVKKLCLWDEFLVFNNHRNTRIFFQTFPLKWNVNPDYYGTWLSDWHTMMNSWDLGQYDLIFSDNYIEPLLYAKNVILGGSFLWHDILSSSFSKDEIYEYSLRSIGLLTEKRPKMIVNKYFVMKNLFSQVIPCGVGIIHFGSRHPHKEKPKEKKKKILLALGNADITDYHIQQVQAFITSADREYFCIYCSEEWKKQLTTYNICLKNYKFESTTNDEMNIAIIRGGIGSISDCIVSRIPMMFINDENVEVQHNQQCLIDMNVGIPLTSANNTETSPLLNHYTYQKMVRNLTQFNLDGTLDAAKILQNNMR